MDSFYDRFLDDPCPGSILDLVNEMILTGVLIYEMVMEEFGFKQLRVSTRGLRFAAVMD